MGEKKYEKLDYISTMDKWYRNRLVRLLQAPKEAGMQKEMDRRRR